MVEREGGAPGVSALLIRLGALQDSAGTSVAYDPRPAAALFPNLPEMEEAALRNESTSLPADLRRVAVEEIGTAVVLPQMQEEVSRNAELFAERFAADLPELIQRAPELAASYRQAPAHLLSKTQREASVPWLLAAFLTSSLVREGWQAQYTVEEGLSLGNGKRRIHPETVVRELTSGELSAAAYQALLAPPGEI